MENQDNHRYDDIINLPNPTSKKHPRMSLYDRAVRPFWVGCLALMARYKYLHRKV